MNTKSDTNTVIAAEPTLDAQMVNICYTNHENHTRIYCIQPKRVWFGVTQWHQKPQWLMEALDVTRGVTRDFAVNDIKAWNVPL
jgi:predicted DNA-binding transcriptional regulator YafY